MNEEIKAQPYTKAVRDTLRCRSSGPTEGAIGRLASIFEAVRDLKPGKCVIVPPSLFDGSNNYPSLEGQARLNRVSSAVRRWVSGFTVNCRTCKDGSVVIFRADDK